MFSTASFSVLLSFPAWVLLAVQMRQSVWLALLVFPAAIVWHLVEVRRTLRARSPFSTNSSDALQEARIFMSYGSADRATAVLRAGLLAEPAARGDFALALSRLERGENF